jgi:uncharacterized protein (TIGR03118 family)
MLSAISFRWSHLRTVVALRRSHLLKRAVTWPGILLMVLGISSGASAQHYQQTNLVSDVPGLAPVTDANLVNPWGLIASATSPWWVADNGTGVSTLYNGAGQKLALTVTIPTPLGGTPPSTPTGIVFNGSSDFGGARFIFVTEDGTVSGWSGGSAAVLKFTSPTPAIYKGATIAQANGLRFLYVANFFNGSVDVFDTNYAPASVPAGAFTDPSLPAGFAPFNVQNINGNLYVTFAKQSADKHDDLHGPGLGFVDAFDPNGVLLRRFRSGHWMNAPWGVALAPDGFGKLSGKLLIGQFGSGEIASFDPDNGNFKGLLRGRHGHPLEIEGLWALRFGNGANAGSLTTLFFTAGIDDEKHGLFGTITPISKKNDDEGDDDDDG